MRAVCIPLLVSVLIIVSGCENRLCSFSHYSDSDGCAAGDLNLSVKALQSRTDVRDKQPLPLQVKVRGTAGPREYWLASPGTVKLGVDGGELAEAKVVLSEDRQGREQTLQVQRDPDPLRPGPLRLQVTVGDLAPVELDPRSHRVFRSPRFDAASKTALIKGSNPHRGGTVQGRITVQVAAPFSGSAPGLLTTELANTLIGAVRWLELFGRAPTGAGLDYSDSASWKALQLKMQESDTALLATTKEILIIYDLDSASGRYDLSMIPYYGTRQSKLSAKEPLIPTQATALAACAEEAVLAIAGSGEVRFFAIDPTQSKVVRPLGTRAVPGVAAPVLAMRDIAGAMPQQPSQKYIAAVADGQGQISLIPLIGTGTSAMLDLGGVLTVQRNGPDRVLALADLDSDGLQDVVFVASDGHLGWLPQEPNGTFPSALDLGLSIPDAASLSVGDLNGDEVPDLAVATTVGAGGNVTVFWNQGS